LRIHVYIKDIGRYNGEKEKKENTMKNSWMGISALALLGSAMGARGDNNAEFRVLANVDPSLELTIDEREGSILGNPGEFLIARLKAKANVLTTLEQSANSEVDGCIAIDVGTRQPLKITGGGNVTLEDGGKGTLTTTEVPCNQQSATVQIDPDNVTKMVDVTVNFKYEKKDAKKLPAGSYVTQITYTATGP
jgi:hypothetical protein